MSRINLTPKEQPEVPLEATNITPDAFAGKSIKEISDLTLWYGNKTVKLGEFFEIEGESGQTPVETTIVIDGDVYNTKHIGQGMTDGEIIVDGNVNMYVGAEMEGGKISVRGNAGSWAGQNMKGGELEIFGNADDYVGASYRGDWRGMSGGTITVHGNAGNEIAEFMLGGKLTVKGNVSIMPGIHMNGGLLIIEGNVVARAGGEMKSGTIVIKGHVDEFLSGFEYLGIEQDLELGGEKLEGHFHKFTGDFATKGSNGLIYVSAAGNNHIIPD